MKTKLRLPERILFALLILLVIINLLILVTAGAPALKRSRAATGLSPTAVITTTPAATATSSFPTVAPVIFPTLQTPVSNLEGMRGHGVWLLAMGDGRYSHLFAYHPQFFTMTRLTDGEWSDRSPSVSPDGRKIAFSSHRNGYWNIYILDLLDGMVSQVTDTPEYDGSPTWSPDGQWIAYESLLDGNLEILVRSLTDTDSPTIRLTDDPGMDMNPAWSPNGREIAFVSTRSGDEDIWVARLGQAEERFLNASRSPGTNEQHPCWSPDGSLLAWSRSTPEGRMIELWDYRNPKARAVQLAAGDWPAWSPDGGSLAASILSPNATSIASYRVATRELIYPAVQLPGGLHGFEWKAGNTPEALVNFPFPNNAASAASPLYTPVISVNPPPPDNRFGLAPLQNVDAPMPYLHDLVDESFSGLREETARQAGWDFLSNLEAAFTQFNTPMAPGMEEDWLLTGRAFAVNSITLSAGWMVVTREEISGQVYWRLFIKTRYQDGSQGEPMRAQPWNLNARYLDNPRLYEQGGEYAAVPSGYWLDFTDLALRYGWERLPSLVNWRTFFPAARFNQFVLTGGLSWGSAMAELYPPEALVTPTFYPTNTRTPTETRLVPDLSTLTPTPSQTATSTLHPTWTPQP